MNMFKPSGAKTISEYFSKLPKERRESVLFLDKFIRKTGPRLKSNFLYNMPGYGTFKYRNNRTKEMLNWPIIALASHKNYISVYVCAVDKGKYLAEKNAKELGKVSVGRSCIRFKKIEDVNLKTLAKVIKLAAKKPGLENSERKFKQK